MSNGMDIDNLSEIGRLCELRTAKSCRNSHSSLRLVRFLSQLDQEFSSDKWQVDFVGGPFRKDPKPTKIDNRFILSGPVRTSHWSEAKMGSAGPKGLRILIYHRKNRHFCLSFFGVAFLFNLI